MNPETGIIACALSRQNSRFAAEGATGAGENGAWAQCSLEQARGGGLYVDGAGAAELFHALHLGAGDVHGIAAVHNALGQQQIRIPCDEHMGNLSLVHRAQQLLGPDNSSVNVGQSFMHSLVLFLSIVLCAYLSHGHLHSKHSNDTIFIAVCQSEFAIFPDLTAFCPVIGRMTSLGRALFGKERVQHREVLPREGHDVVPLRAL